MKKIFFFQKINFFLFWPYWPLWQHCPIKKVQGLYHKTFQGRNKFRSMVSLAQTNALAYYTTDFNFDPKQFLAQTNTLAYYTTDFNFDPKQFLAQTNTLAYYTTDFNYDGNQFLAQTNTLAYYTTDFNYDGNQLYDTGSRCKFTLFGKLDRFITVHYFSQNTKMVLLAKNE